MPYQYDRVAPRPVKPSVMPANSPLTSNQTPGGLSGNINNQRYGVGTVSMPGFNRPMRPPVGNGRPSNVGMPSNPGGQFDPTSSINSAYDQAMRSMQPQMDSEQRRFEQSMLSRGLDPNSSAFRGAYDNQSRRRNDMLQSAAYGAQRQGMADQQQIWNQGYQYDALSNQLRQAQIGANASRYGSDASQRASMYGSDASMYNAGLSHLLGTNQLNEGARQFDINDVNWNQNFNGQMMLGMGNLYNQMNLTDINRFNAQQGANQNWFNNTGSLTNNAPGVSFTPSGNYVGNQIGANQNMMGAQQYGNNALAGLLAGGMSMIPSDYTLKENIELVDRIDGINVYEFDYKDKSIGEGRYRGVMAQEIMINYPEAVIDVGYYMVDYSQLPVDMVRV